MIGIIRYLKGYVKLKVWGYAPERFMNLCTNRGIILWGICGCGGYYTLYIGLSDFFTIRDIVKKTKTRVAVLERCGLPFLIRDIRARKMFASGIVLCLCFLVLMSRFIWSIRLEGNLLITDDELFDFLAQEGVAYGVRKKTVQPTQLEEAIREQFRQITWASVQLDGTQVTLHIRENDLPSKEEQQKAAERYENGADLVAATSGSVAEILTRTGVPQVKAGDEVQKGDVLISGLIPVCNDDGTVREWKNCIADGDIRLQCTEPVQLTQKLAYQYKNYTGRKKEYRFFSIAGKQYRFPAGRCRYVCYDEVTEEKQLRLFSQIDLPFFYGTVCCREYLPVDAIYDEKAALTLLSGRFQKFLHGLQEKGVQIIEKDVKIVRKTGALLLQGNLTLLQEAVLIQARPETANAEGTPGQTE